MILFESEYTDASPLMKSIARTSPIFLIVAFAAQLAWAGGGTVHVHGYYRKDGTYVHAYDRSAPGTASSTSSISGSTTSVSSTAPANVPSKSNAPVFIPVGPDPARRISGSPNTQKR